MAQVVIGPQPAASRREELDQRRTKALAADQPLPATTTFNYSRGLA